MRRDVTDLEELAEKVLLEWDGIRISISADDLFDHLSTHHHDVLRRAMESLVVEKIRDRVDHFRECLQCGEGFFVRRPRHGRGMEKVYCRPSCRQLAYYERKRTA